jgi:hypothetical protein
MVGSSHGDIPTVPAFSSCPPIPNRSTNVVLWSYRPRRTLSLSNKIRRNALIPQQSRQGIFPVDNSPFADLAEYVVDEK